MLGWESRFLIWKKQAQKIFEQIQKSIPRTLSQTLGKYQSKSKKPSTERNAENEIKRYFDNDINTC